ncbi:MAG: hypothetical protein Q8Q59_04235 [Luteolibacter sp.]|nr:hypothetical protein [Luteolibacter sp.]
MTPLEKFLNERDPRDSAALVERLYQFLPAPIARLAEKRLVRRHMRSIASRISFRRNDDSGWTVRHGTQAVAQSRPLGHLVGRIDRPVTIVATGPSAKDHDWEELRDGGRFVIAVAGAPTFLKSVGVRPDLLVVSDSRFARYGIEHIRNAAGVPMVTVLRAASFLATESRNELVSRPFSLIEQINSWYGLPKLPHEALLALNGKSDSPFHFANTRDPHYRTGWSAAPELGYFSGCTVAFVALQIAVRLGARDIEIVGMDLSGAGRVYDDGEHAVRNTLMYHYEPVILPSFEMMAQVLKGSEIKVRNLSPVCALPRSLFS